VRVCAIEVPASWGERARVLARVERELAAGPPAPLVLLPEACLDGYISPRAECDLSPFAEAPDGPACQALSGLARKHAVVLAGSFVERDGPRCYNALAVFGPDGGVVARYRKRHPWVIEAWATPGEAPPPVFDVGGLRVTVAMCFDVHFLAEDAASQLREADVLLFPSAWVEEAGDTRDTLLPELAREFDVAIVNANWGVGVPRVQGQGGSRIVGRDGAVVARASGPGRIEADCLRTSAEPTSVPRP
jgi:predicted amidohydrolase